MKKADHENIVSNLNAAHEKELRELTSKHQQEMKDACKLIKDARASLKRQWEVHDKKMAEVEENAETQKEFIMAATTAATKAAESVKEVYNKKMAEVEEKHKREMSELQEKLANVTLERDKARAAISDMVNLGTESLASSSSGPTDKQSTDIDSFRAVADLDKLRQGALDAIDSFQPEGSEDKFLSNLKALHQRESKRLEDKQTTDSDLSSEERAVVDIDELRKGLPDTASLITSILGEERGRSLVAEMKKHQERHV